MSKILVIGATGNVGRQLVSRLLATGVHVRALARTPQTAGLPPQVEVAPGDLTIPETLDPCLDGIDAVFLLWFAPSPAVGPALARILKHTRRIVFLSSPHKTPHPFFQAAQPNPAVAVHKEIERLIEASGCQWTFLRPSMFAANARSWWAPKIRAGDNVIRWPYADAPTAPIHEQDIAAVAVLALCEDGHAGREYVLTGPQSLTQSEQISIIGDVIGRHLRMEGISAEDARRELLAQLPAPVVKMLIDAWAGAIGQPAFLTSAVREITGTEARTFRDWVADNAADFQP